MDLAAILIGLAIAVLVAAYVSQPLMRKPRPASSPGGESPRERLEAEYRMTLEAIRDLDFDFQTGKLVEPDYRALREQYAARGAAQLKELDQLGGLAESAVRARRKQSSRRASDEIEAMVQARRKARAAARACPACRQPAQPGDRFCSKCGAALEAKTCNHRRVA